MTKERLSEIEEKKSTKVIHPEDYIFLKDWEKNKQCLKDLWLNTRRFNIHVIGVLEGEERKKRGQKMFEEIV